MSVAHFFKFKAMQTAAEAAVCKQWGGGVQQQTE
jgi:hypothetical protein